MADKVTSSEISLGVAATLLHVDRATVRRWIVKGLLPARRTLGGQFRVDRAVVELMAAERYVPEAGDSKRRKEDRTPPTS